MDQGHAGIVAGDCQTRHPIPVHRQGPCGIRLRFIHGSISRRIDADVWLDLLEHAIDAGLLSEVQYWPAPPHDDKARLLQAGEEFLG